MTERSARECVIASGQIELRDLRVTARVGVGDAERAAAQPLSIDADIEVDLGRASASDDVADTVDYGAAATAIAETIGRGEYRLLERLARAVAEAVFGTDERATAVTVTVRKLRPPVPVDIATTGVTVRFEPA